MKPSEKEEGDNGQTYTFRFPKEHTEYHYYDEKGTQLSVGVRINDRNNSGRFIYEQEDGKPPSRLSCDLRMALLITIRSWSAIRS